MVAWRVSEPHINLWLHDTPLAYPTTVGSEISFDLNFKQRDEWGLWTLPSEWHGDGYGPILTTVGKNWACSWIGAVIATFENLSVPWDAYFYRPGGGYAVYSFSAGNNVSAINYRDNSWMEVSRDGNNTLLAVTVRFADGSRWTFGHHNPSVRWGYYFLSGRTDPAGHTTVFQYDSSATNMVALSGGTNNW